MFLVLVTILLFTIFFYEFKKKNNNKYLIALLIFYFVSSLSILLYVSKDIYYYNQIRNYFYLPNFLWRWLFFTSISKINIIRVMNISSIAIVILSTYFTLSFYKKHFIKFQSVIKKILLIYGTVTILVFDPYITIKLYNFLYPNYVTVSHFNQINNNIFIITHVVNIGIVLLNIFLLLYALIKSPKLMIFKLNYLLLNFSYSILSMVYIFFISAAPNYLLKISKVAGIYTCKSFKLHENASFYQILQFFMVFSSIIVVYCTYRLDKINSEENLNKICISKEISASETTSKIFCHYIKNEILAIKSEAEFLKRPDSSEENLNNIINRCNTLYDRIDEIHRSTKTSKLNLKLCSLQDVINHSLSSFSYDLKDIELSLNLPQNDICALVDKVYLEQAINNIIKNSIDSMEENTINPKKLKITLSTVQNWIQISIEDTGCGISKENLTNIFRPFYSSHTYSKHWGIGLTLSYKIVQAHEGKILVSSTISKGSTITILLPYII